MFNERASLSRLYIHCLPSSFIFPFPVALTTYLLFLCSLVSVSLVVCYFLTFFRTHFIYFIFVLVNLFACSYIYLLQSNIH
jgi:hypothetical protein